MRPWRFITLIVASAATLAAQTDPPGRAGRLNYMEGPVSFQPAGVNDWVDASLNRPLIAGDYIWVGDRGRAELHVGSAALRLGANTAFEFLNLDDRTVQIRLGEGTLTVRLRYLAPGQVFEVDTPNLAFNLVRPGDYRIDANPDSQTTVVTVRDGEADVTGGGQVFTLYARQRAVVRGGDRITYALSASPGLDAWDQWCSLRDRREDQSRSARFVSREVAGYDDLDQYGRWQEEPGYGYVWFPNSVAAGWAPYHDGHWAWIEPWGWTWVDDAPWGFAPYHYGRWASLRGRWCWVPGPYGVAPVYAPALVAWIGGSGFSASFSIGGGPAVGWFPLAPREPYFPSYQVSQVYFTRVNNTNTLINNAAIISYYGYSRTSNNAAIPNIRYANRSVPNGVTLVPQGTFARGRRVTQDAQAVPPSQLASAQVFRAPSIAPLRESVLGARADTASRAARPPARILSRPVVARMAPAPAPVPFERRQPALSQNPGRPLPPAAVQQMRRSAPAASAPVRIVDMGRVRRVQPAAGAGSPQPDIAGRRNGPPSQQPQAQAPQSAGRQPPVVERRPPQQSPQQQQAERQQPPGNERRNGPPGRQQPQARTPPRMERPQPPVVERRPPQQPPQQQAERPQPPGRERRNEPPPRQQPQAQAPPPKAGPPQSPPADREQRQARGKPREDDKEKRSNR
jgi:uncharacterized protein DUF6600